MVDKLQPGEYECEVCGRRISGHRKAKRHERLCGIDKISGYYEGVENIWNLEIPDMKDSSTEENTRQLKIGESFLGYCSKCDSRIISENRFKDGSDLFECDVCGKINRFED